MSAKGNPAQTTSSDSIFQREIAKYRASLIKLEQEMQREYDKAVMALSGGAFGVSLTFLKDIVGSSRITQPLFLLVAWVCWGISVTSVLFSYFASTLALRATLKQVDDKMLYSPGQRIGRWYDSVTKVLNVSGGMLFLLGVICIVIFASVNFMPPKTNLPAPTLPTNPGKGSVGQVVPRPPQPPLTPPPNTTKGQVVPPPPPKP